MTKEDTIFYAKLAEQAERYEDMVKHMKEIANVYPRFDRRRVRKS